MNITDSKEPKLIDVIDRLNHVEDTNATISCSLASGDLNGIAYEWFKDDRRISPSSNQGKFSIFQPMNFQSILRVVDLKPSDSGVYSCLAKNPYGQSKIAIKLHVKGKDKLLIWPPQLAGDARH